MTGRILNTFINDLIARTDIVDFINNKIPLKKQGKNYNSCCPFHNETTPSFTVNSNQQFYYCFGCGTHGNIIDFIMNYEKLNFIETIEELAAIHGLEIIYEYQKYPSKIKQYYRHDLYELMNDINNLYQDRLHNSKSQKAKQYLIERGLTDKIIHHFSIGFSLNGWNDLKKIFSKKNNIIKQLNAVGMIIINNNGHIYDRFRERIMFPIRDRRGNIIGFGGRSINNTLPKYINSPETEIFHKGRQLYGLHEIIQNNSIISKLLIVEGYMDVITLAQFGINFAVASLGSFITKEHINSIFRITNTVICCYDGDIAGHKAAWRTLEITIPYLKDGYQIKFMFLPNKEDPDSLIRKEGKEKFEQRINNSQSLIIFLFDTLIKQVNLCHHEGKAKFMSLVIPYIKQIPSNTLQLYLVQKLGKLIGIPDTIYLIKIINNHNLLEKKIKYSKKNIRPTTIRILIALLIQNPHFVKLISNIDYIQNSKLIGIQLFLELINFCQSFPGINTAQLLEFYRHKTMIIQLKKLASWKNITIEHMTEQYFKDALKHLWITILDEKFNFLITKERIEGLSPKERKEVHFITISRAKYH